MAKSVFMEKKKLFTGKMNLELMKRIIYQSINIRILKCLVWSVTL